MSTRELLSRLVSFPVLGGQSNLEIISFIDQYLKEFGVETHFVPNEDRTKKSLHCRIGPPVDGGYILSGHTDVVPVNGQPWDTDPFVLTEKDGRFYGRGSCDMKGFLACCLSVVPEMATADLKVPIYLAFSYDEEIGCLAGPALAEDILRTYEEKPRYAIVGEPSMMEVINGQKGICVFETTVTGSQGHSSRIRQEVSAVHTAAKLINWIESYMDRLILENRLDPRFDPPHTSLHVGEIQGGTAPNIIARNCTFRWDLRCVPMDSVDKIESDFQAFCSELEKKLKAIHPDASIATIRDHPAVPPLDTDESASIVSIVQSISGNPGLQTVAYAAESGQFAEAGFETVICGPGSIAQAHRANEFIEIDQLKKGEKFISRLVKFLSS